MTTTIMGMSVTSASAHLSSSASTTRPVLYALSSSNWSISPSSQPKVSIFNVFIRPFSPWSGLKHLGISLASSKSLKLERKRRCKGMSVRASLFGVGAPEALVIGVVALLVFGPKGLAEIARNLGKTLRAFQPTIRELQEVSREFKSTLEREIGLDDINAQNTYNSNRANSKGSSSSPSTSAVDEKPQDVADPNGAASPTKAYSSEDYLKVTEEQLKAAAAAQQSGQTSTPGEGQPEFPSTPQAEETTSMVPPPMKSENNT